MDDLLPQSGCGEGAAALGALRAGRALSAVLSAGPAPSRSWALKNKGALLCLLFLPFFLRWTWMKELYSIEIVLHYGQKKKKN